MHIWSGMVEISVQASYQKMNLDHSCKESWPEGGLEYLGCCPACGSEAREIQYESLRDLLYAAPGIWTMYWCKSCDVRYLDPRPDKDSLPLAYERYYTHQDGIENAGDSAWGAIKLALRNGYLNSNWQTTYSPAFGLTAKFFSFVYPGWAKTYEHLATRDLPRNIKGSLLDIGCGNGIYIQRIKELGWSVKGIDFDRNAVEAARKRNLDVQLGGIELFDDKQEMFDVITANHVIEHLPDPVVFLNACWRLLRQGGMLRIESPNFDSDGREIFGKNWRGLEPPRHLVLFNSRNMKKFLNDAGFRNIKHAGWMPQYVLMYQASKNLQNLRPQGEKNINLIEKIKIKLHDLFLRKNEAKREFFTYICIK